MMDRWQKEYGMRKKILSLILVLIIALPVLAIEPILQASSNNNPIKNYYSFDGNKFIFVPTDKKNYKAYSKYQRKFYKENILKNQKKLLKAEKSKSYKDKIYYYSKILAKNEFYTPALFDLLNLYFQNKDYANTIIIVKKLSIDDNLISKNYLKEILAVTTYLTGDYTNALPLLLEIDNIDKENEFDCYKYKIATSYYKLGDEANAIKYSKLASINDGDYSDCQNLLYVIYFNQKNYNEAILYAKELIRIFPDDAKQYMRISACSNDIDVKLDNYYKAQVLYSSSNKTKELIWVDSLIANLEQSKIENAVKNLKSFVNKPDWMKILGNNNSYLEPYYWTNRQYEFFKETNNCIKKYKGNELCKCFEAVNKEQAMISLQRQKDLELRQQKEIANLQLQQQEKAIAAQQNFQERQLKLQKQAINNSYWQNQAIYSQNQQLINSINSPRYYNVTPTGVGGYYINRY